MRKTALTSTAGLIAALGLVACDPGGFADEDAADYPSQDMNWTIAFGPGGGNDIMSRTMIDIIDTHDLYPHSISVENRDGGSGATGWGYLFSRSGSGYDVSTTSGSFITTPMQADTGWEPEDFTHVGLFAADNALLSVHGNSDVEDFDDWVAYAQAEGQVVVGGIGTVNVDYIVHELIAEYEGYGIDYVPFNDEGQMQTALLSGAIDAMVSNPAESMGQIEGGQIRPLLFTGPERLDSLPDVPTGEERGMEELPSMPRGLILPPDAPDYALEWWIDTMQQVVETEEWEDYLAKNYLVPDIRWGEDFSAYLDEVHDEFEEILTELGAL